MNADRYEELRRQHSTLPAVQQAAALQGVAANDPRVGVVFALIEELREDAVRSLAQPERCHHETALPLAHNAGGVYALDRLEGRLRMLLSLSLRGRRPREAATDGANET